MDENYYLIPVISEHTYVNNLKFSDLYNDKFPLLKDIKNKRDECNCEESNYKRFNSIINKLCSILKIPEYILVIEKGDRCFELITDFEISTDDITDFKKYEVEDASEVVNYFVKSDYKSKLCKLYKNYGLIKEKALIKKISGY